MLGSVSASASTDALPPAVQDLLRQSRIKDSELGFYIQAVNADEASIARNAKEQFVIASTAKLPTTIAALDVLGSKYRFRTAVYLRGSLKDGQLEGNVEIIGSGDPSLDAEGLSTLMKRLVKRGVKHINGDIVINRRAFWINEKDHAQTPEPNADRVHHARPDAFLVNQSILNIEFEPDPNNAGRGFKINATPRLAGVEIVNSMKGIAGPCLRHKSSLDFTLDASKKVLTLTGKYPVECGQRRWELSPYSAQEFSQLATHQAWLDAGGTLTGTVRDAPAAVESKGRKPVTKRARPLARPFISHESIALPEIIDEVNKWSNNVLSRHLFLALSSQFPQRAANLRDARRGMKEWLEKNGLSEADMKLDNGSGLSREEKASPEAMGKLLVAAWRKDHLRQAFTASLPVVGVDGTMGNRLKSSSAAGKAFIKTGTLTAVRSIAGYVTARSGITYALVAFANSPNAHLAQAAHDKLIEWLYING